MPLHPDVQAMRARRAAAGTPALYTQTVADARAADLAQIRASAGEPEPVYAVQELKITGPSARGDGGTNETADAGLPVRVYRPDGASGHPVLVYFYGGGWTLGSLDTCDALCRDLTNAVGCVTVSVGYRLAPEHRFPAAVEDCYAGVCWVAAEAERLGVDAGRIAVGGDSAGGNLAAAVTLLDAARGGPPIRHQLLVYPNTDHLADTPSMRENTDPLLFNRTSVAWYWNHYLATPEDGADPMASPLRATDLRGLPEATVITAEFDPLRDEGEAYARRLAEAGVPVETRRYDGMPHGFFTMTGTLEAARDAHAYATARLRAAFARQPGEPRRPRQASR